MLSTVFLWIVLLAPGQTLHEVPGPFDHLIPEHIDKVVHFLLFFFETRFLFLAFRHLRFFGQTKTVVAAAMTAGIMAVATEAVQTRLPSRSGDPWDLAADVAGIAAWLLWQARNASTHGLENE